MPCGLPAESKDYSAVVAYPSSPEQQLSDRGAEWAAQGWRAREWKQRRDEVVSYENESELARGRGSLGGCGERVAAGAPRGDGPAASRPL